MKLQIISLDQHDDLLSVRDKITWAKSPRILLVWPDTGRVLTRRLDLVILQRSSQQMGAQLGLVTQDIEIIRNASETGIPVFTSVASAQKSYWKYHHKPGRLLPDRRPPQALREAQASSRVSDLPGWVENRWARYAGFILAILCVVALIASFVPSATIVLAPQTSSQSLTIPVIASSQTRAVNLTGNLPAHLLTVIVEGQDQTPATGQVSVPDQKATGMVRFTNLTAQAVDVPVGTVVSDAGSPAIRFATTSDGWVAAGPGTSTDLPVEAINPGEDGNLADHAIKAIESSLGLVLTATNPYAMRGGSSNLSLAARQADYDQLYARLVKQLQSSALAQLSKMLSTGDQLIQESVQVKQVLDKKTSPPPGEPAENASLTLRLEFSGWVISGSDLHTLALEALNATLPHGVIPIDSTLVVSPSGQPRVDDSGIHLALKVQRQVMASLPADQVVANAKGLSPADAAVRLAQLYPLKNQPTVQLNPAWWPRLPIFPFRIGVELSGLS